MTSKANHDLADSLACRSSGAPLQAAREGRAMEETLFIEELDGPTISAWQHYCEQAGDRAEHEAEMRNEQYFESRGYWEARAQEAYELSMGITF